MKLFLDIKRLFFAFILVFSITEKAFAQSAIEKKRKTCIEETRFHHTYNKHKLLDNIDYKLLLPICTEALASYPNDKNLLFGLGRVHESNKEYKKAIKMGIAKEVARKILPEGLTKTRLYMNGTLRSWVHYIDLRSANGTQKEHMEIAKACAEVITKIFPRIDSQ